VPGYESNCDGVVTVAPVFAYGGGGGDSVCCFVLREGAIVML
jgi:hypothetical protein